MYLVKTVLYICFFTIPLLIDFILYYSSSMLEFECEKLLMNQMTTSPEISSHALKWIQEILACRVDFFIQNPDKMNYSQKSEAVKKAQVFI